MHHSSIQIGDLVEDCSLMPGKVISINGDDVNIRRFDIEYTEKEIQLQSFSNCSLTHCGVVKLTQEEVDRRLEIGKDELSRLYSEVMEAGYDTYEEAYAHYIESIKNYGN